MEQSYTSRWVVQLDGFHMIIKHKLYKKHQNVNSLSKNTYFYKWLE